MPIAMGPMPSKRSGDSAFSRSAEGAVVDGAIAPLPPKRTRMTVAESGLPSSLEESRKSTAPAFSVGERKATVPSKGPIVSPAPVTKDVPSADPTRIPSSRTSTATVPSYACALPVTRNGDPTWADGAGAVTAIRPPRAAVTVHGPPSPTRWSVNVVVNVDRVLGRRSIVPPLNAPRTGLGMPR